MKTTISNILLLIAIVFSNTVLAQVSKRTIKESTIDNTTYVIEQWGNNRDFIKNKNDIYAKLVKKLLIGKKSCDYAHVQDQQLLTKQLTLMARNIFTTPRIKQLSTDNKNNFEVDYICNRDGDILAVHFLGVNTSIISLKEIKALEDAFLKMRIKWDVSLCPDVNYFMFCQIIKFKNYL